MKWTLMMTIGAGVPLLALHADARGQNCLEFDAFDLNSDGVVDPIDAGFVLARLGCVVGVGDSDCDASDINGDGIVDPLDSGAVLSRFGCERVMFSGLFYENPELWLGKSVYDIASSDLNGDGLLDLVGTDYYDDQVVVYLNRGLNLLPVADAYPIGATPWTLKIADFDGDEHPDLVTQPFGGETHVLLNNGSGQFDDSVKSEVIAGSDVQAVADIDGDGDLDLVNSCCYQSISIARNLGDGEYVPDLIYQIGVNVSNLAILDVDDNGAPDIVFANPEESRIDALFNHGDGTFSAGEVFDLGSSPDHLVSGDLDGDGLLDLAVSDGIDDTCSIVRNLGSGMFEVISTVAIKHPFNVLLAGDVNLDGATDLAGSGERLFDDGAETISVLLNEGQAVFTEPIDYNADLGPYGLVLCDINGDRWPDLAGINPYPKIASFLLGDTQGQFHANAGYEVGSATEAVTSGDLSGDGYPELITAGWGSHSKGVSILNNSGLGEFADFLILSTGVETTDVVAADLDGDSDLDLATADWSSKTISVFLNSGDGSFAPRLVETAGNYPISIAAGDLTSDGLPELLVANYLGNNFSMFKNLGAGDFADHQVFPTGSRPVDLALGDLDGDQNLDVVTSSENSATISILFSDGVGGFGTKIDYSVFGYRRPDVEIADLDGDGSLDLAVAVDDYPDHLSLFFNDGSGTFLDDVTVETSPPGTDDAPNAVAAGDVDGDGDLDLFVSNDYGTNVLVLRNSGDGTFFEDFHYGVAREPGEIALDDFDLDADLDVATVNLNADTVSVLLNRRIP